MIKAAAYILGALVIAGSTFSAACFSPTAPSAYTCRTQPRWYCSPDGRTCWQEVDTYTQAQPCPRVPIK